MSWNTRRNQIVAAVDSTVQVFNMRDPGNCFKIYVVIYHFRDWVCWVWDLERDTVLCSWTRQLTCTVPLSTQVYKWVPANLMLSVTLRWTSIPPEGSRNTPSGFMLQKPKISTSQSRGSYICMGYWPSVRSRWLGIDQIPFLRVYGLRESPDP